MDAAFNRADHTQNAYKFSALDSELPVLAARAALQLDNLIINQCNNSHLLHPGFDAISALASKVLSDPNVTHATSVRSLMDPVTATVFSKAYSEARSTKPLESYKELDEAVRSLQKLFEDVEHRPQKESLTMLRDFCVQLSNYAASQRQSVYGRVTQPYKK